MSPQSPDPLTELYDRHAPSLHAFALSLTRSGADSQDLLQDVFIKIARNPSLLVGLRDERGFLLRSLHNAAIDLFRRQALRASRCEVLEEEPAMLFAPDADPDEAAFRAALSDAMGELPPDQRAVLHLKLWEGRTFDAIADLLEIPLNTAASRYRYGLDKLRSRLRPLYEELR